MQALCIAWALLKRPRQAEVPGSVALRPQVPPGGSPHQNVHDWPYNCKGLPRRLPTWLSQVLIPESTFCTSLAKGAPCCVWYGLQGQSDLVRMKRLVVPHLLYDNSQQEVVTIEA